MVHTSTETKVGFESSGTTGGVYGAYGWGFSHVVHVSPGRESASSTAVGSTPMS